MNLFLAGIDGHASPPTFPSGVHPLEWPDTLVGISQSGLSSAIRSVLLLRTDGQLNRYGHFCRSVWLLLLFRKSRYAALERRFDHDVTYSEAQLRAYLAALPLAQLSVASRLPARIRSELLSIQLGDHVKVLPSSMTTMDMIDLIGLFLAIMVIPAEPLERMLSTLP